VLFQLVPPPLQIPAPYILRKISHLRNGKIVLSTNKTKLMILLLKATILSQPVIFAEIYFIPTSNLPSHILMDNVEVRLLI